MKYLLRKTAMLVVVLAMIAGCEPESARVNSTFEKVYVQSHEDADGNIPVGTVQIVELTHSHPESGGAFYVTMKPDGSEIYHTGPDSILDGLRVGMIIGDNELPGKATERTQKNKSAKKNVKKKLKKPKAKTTDDSVSELANAFGSYWDWMEGRADKVESRLDAVETRLGKLEKSQDEMKRDLDEIARDIATLVKRMDEKK